ncbi:glycerol-3-phosphate 1-O-acyltransferase PlsY [Chloroflexota bacterium]
MIIVMYVAVVLIGYLLGSIPFGLWISQRISGTDIRQVGSGKIGMTNVMRAAGKKAAAVALLLDMAKGALAVILAGLIFRENQNIAQTAAALASVIGHNWSIFLKFKGGRGVATFVGSLFALYWPIGLIGGALILIIGFSTRYMSLGSIIGAVTSFIMLMSLYVLQINLLGPYPPFEYVIFAMICAIFIYVRHRDNIVRLVSGTERKLGDKATAVNSSSPGDNK